jgi:predicted MPP superfamily phosphohydrolase
MIPLLPWGTTGMLFALSTLITTAGVTLYDARLWRSSWFVRSIAAVWLMITLGLLLWRLKHPTAAALGVELTWFLLPLFSLAGLGLWLAAPLHRVLGWLARRGVREVKSGRGRARRQFLRQAAAMLPATAVAAGTAAMTGNDTTRVVQVPLAFADLPRALDGLRLLHLSDLHLGVGRTSADLARLLDGLRSEPPDLIVLTGDVADRVEELESALELLTAFAPRLGVYAALGNHEYLNDIEQMLPVYRKSSVRLLVNESATLAIGEASLFLAGVDDPVLRGPARPFFAQAVAECAAGAPAAAFRLLLCHRPEGFEAAAEHGFHLTLSGHTHGGQIGIAGRSVFEVLWGIPYLWGAYRRGDSRLYTTSGFGHWFPFRLNCPAEAPVITLRRA